MKKQLSNVSVVVGLLLALSAFSVSAHDGVKLRTKLVGAQEVPVVSTQASGDFEARIESDGSVSYKLSYEGLEGGNTLFAHIHLGQRSVNGGVMAFLCGGGTKPTPCPNQSGTVEGTITATDILGLATQQLPAAGFDEFVRALRNGNAYANVHTTASPGGEIRGQIRADNGRHNGHDDHDHHGGWW
ncbi:MAG TPA: CHRD domain-containing protein [Blastocatellia bacterium]|nr:CHRD domain-containing protein [Blastocatellia bacterium]